MIPVRDPSDHLVQTIYDFGRVMRQKMMTSEDSKGGMNMGQLHTLLLVQDRSGMTMKELAEALHITSPSATALVNRVVRMGWIERQQDPENRKLVRLRVTTAGSRLLERKNKQRAAILKEMFSILTPAEQRTLATLHEKLLKHSA